MWAIWICDDWLTEPSSSSYSCDSVFSFRFLQFPHQLPSIRARTKVFFQLICIFMNWVCAITCSAGRIFRKPREGVHGCEAGAYRLQPSLVNGKVNISGSTGLQHSRGTMTVVLKHEKWKQDFTNNEQQRFRAVLCKYTDNYLLLTSDTLLLL